MEEVTVRDPLEVIKFWCCSGFGRGIVVDMQSLSTSINSTVTEIGLYTIYCHSTEGATALLIVNAAAVAEFAMHSSRLEHILLFKFSK